MMDTFILRHRGRTLPGAYASWEEARSAAVERMRQEGRRGVAIRTLRELPVLEEEAVADKHGEGREAKGKDNCPDPARAADAEVRAFPPAPLPDAPTSALPGSPEKLAVMRARRRRRQQLFHPDDRPDRRFDIEGAGL